MYYSLFLKNNQYVDSLLLPETDSYHIWEKRWIESPGTIARYMCAAKWKLDDAQKRIKGTVEWRREYKPDLIPPEEVRVESETGKMCVYCTATSTDLKFTFQHSYWIRLRRTSNHLYASWKGEHSDKSPSTQTSCLLSVCVHFILWELH